MKFFIKIVFVILSISSLNSFAQTSFLPSDLPGLQLWLSADSGLVLNGSNVEQWQDRSGNHKNAVELSISNQPLKVNMVSQLNNLPAIRFDGTDDDLKIDSAVKVGTAFVVSNWQGGGTFPNYNGLLVRGDLSATPYYMLCMNSGSTGVSIAQPYNSFSGIYNNGVSSSSYAPLSTYKIISGEDMSMRSFNKLVVGNNPLDGGNNRWNGDIAEIIVYDNVLSNSDRVLVETYLMDKYAPSVNLGSDINSSIFCNTNIDAGSRFTNFLWSTGSSTATISVDSAGSYWVEATDIFGRISRDTIQVIYPVITYPTGGPSLCLGSNKVWDSGFSKNTYSFQWQDNSTDSIFTITNAGQYWVKIIDTSGCFVYSDTLTFTIDNFPQIASLGSDTTLCSGNSIYLKTGAGQAINYLWNDASTNDSLQITTTDQYWVTVTNSNNCSKIDSINITISGTAPTADFSSSTTCFGNPTQFNDLSTPVGGNTITNWQWNFGELSNSLNDTSTLENPQHTYTNTGAYTVTLISTTNVGCSSEITKTVTVYELPVSNYSYTLNCSGSNTQFFDSTTVNGSQITSWKWNFGESSSGLNDTSTFQNSIHQYSLVGNYNVKLIAQSTQGCIDSITKPVNVNPSIINLSPVLISPAYNNLISSTSVILEWSSNLCYASSQVNVATDAAFTNIIANQTIGADSILITGLVIGNNYYWRVRYFDGISYSLWSSVSVFHVFTPTGISGLQLWLSSDSGLVLNGSNVEQWQDRSGNHKNAVELSISNQPLKVNMVSQLNNLPAIRFDGTDDDLKIDSAVKVGTAFVVSNWQGGGTFPNYNGLLVRGDLSATPYYMLCMNSGSTGVSIAQPYNSFSGIYNNGVSSSSYAPLSTYKIISGEDMSMRSFNKLVVGNNPLDGGNNRWNGDIAEIIVYDNVLSNSDRVLVETYLMDKYAPSVNLGSDINSSIFCNTNIDAGSRFTNFLWSTGSSTATISVDSAGSYWVEATDIFGRISRDTIQVIYPVITYPTGGPSLCLGSNKVWDSGFSKNTYSFQWQDNSTDSIFTITNAGQYWVKIIDTSGCFVYSDTLTFTIDNFPQIASLGSDTTLCSGNSIYLKTGAGQAINYLWNDASTNDSLQITTTDQYWVTVTNSNNCSKIDSINITISGTAPTADFSSSTTCFGNPTQFNDLSTPVGGNTITNWQWNFGELSNSLNDTSTLENPQHTYTNTGAYTVTLISTTNVGCSSEITKTVTVYELPVSNYSYTLNCSGSNTQFFDSTTVNGSQITSWKWNFGESSSGLNDTSTFQNSIHQYSLVGNYNVKLIAQSTQGCIDSITKPVNVNPSIINLSPVLISPAYNNLISSTSVILEWSSNLCYASSQVNVATDAAFTNIIANQTIGADSILITGLVIGNNYYWRVRYFDGISYSLWSSVSVFHVFTPTGISGLQLWLSSDSGLVLNGSNVEQWQDRSGNHKNAVELSISNQPLKVNMVSQLNNLPAIRFDGTDDDLKIDSAVKVGTAFVVSNWQGGGTFPNYNGLLVRGDLSATPYYMLCMNSGSTGVSIAQPYNSFSGIYNNGVSSSSYAPLSTYKIISGEDMSMRSFNKLVVGNNPLDGGNNRWNGDIAEIIVYDNVLSNSDRVLVETYLMDKYAPSVNLGSDINSSIFCNTNIDAGSRFTNFLWSTGSSTATISVDSAGSYWVEATDIFGRISRDTIQVIYPVITYPTGGPSLCLGSNKVWDSGFSKNTYSFQWQDNSTDSIFTITNAGQYWVKIIDTSGCFVYSDTLTFTIDNFPQIASLGSDTTLCSGNSIYLKTGAGQAINYLWNDASTNDSLQITTTDQYWVTVTNSNNCSKIDSINITISGTAPTADFSSSTTCFGNATQFNDLSNPFLGDTIIARNWDFGDTFTSNTQNPLHTYTDTGIYIVRLTVITNTGCSSAINKIVSVYPKPVVNFASSNLCENSGVQFTGLASTSGYPITQWNWDFGDVGSGSTNLSILQNPLHVYSNTGSYTVQLFVQNAYGCSDTSVNSLVIKPAPVSDFGFSSACKNDLVYFTDSSTFPASTVLQSSFWNFGDNGVSFQLNPNHAYSSTVTYNVFHVVTATNGCKDTAFKSITVYPTPNAYFSFGNACVNSPITFTDLSVISGGTITNWLWDFNNSLTSNLPNPQFTTANTGNSNVQLLVTSNHGCKDSMMQTIVVNALPIADFTFTPAFGNPPLAVTFTNTSTGATSYLWDFGDAIQSTLINPFHTYIDTGSFNISLTATTNLGCTKTKAKTINVLRRLIDVAIIDITTSLQNNFLNTTAQIVNLGTTDISSMEFYVQVNNGPRVKENWIGVLPSSNILVYNLNTSIYLEDAEHYVCLTIEKPNHADDENPANNSLCEALNTSVFQILEPFPNPSSDVFTLPLVIPEIKNLDITIYDSQGNSIKTAYSGNINKGLQLLAINISELNPGFYACKIEYGNETVIKKIIKH